jgi:hypothetical protein
VDWSSAYEAKDNLNFFADAIAAFAQQGVGNGGSMLIGLLGQRDLPGVTLRRAQSVLRWDLRPSLWSHAFLVARSVPADPQQLVDAPLWEVPIFARTGVFPPPEENAVSRGRLGLYADRRLEANVALLAIAMNNEDAEKVADQAAHPNRDRLRYNLWEALGVWQTYLWASDTRPNPLREGFPIAASAFVEYAFEAIQLDVSPGASERNSAPEHLWNAAKWWHETFTQFEHPVRGYYALRDKGCAVLSTDD